MPFGLFRPLAGPDVARDRRHPQKLLADAVDVMGLLHVHTNLGGSLPALTSSSAGSCCTKGTAANATAWRERTSLISPITSGMVTSCSPNVCSCTPAIMALASTTATLCPEGRIECMGCSLTGCLFAAAAHAMALFWRPEVDGFNVVLLKLRQFCHQWDAPRWRCPATCVKHFEHLSVRSALSRQIGHQLRCDPVVH